MTHVGKRIKGLAVAASLLTAMLLPMHASLASDKAESKGKSGKELAFNRKKGNCLACHMIEGGEMAGNIAPPLIGMKDRYPDKKKLRAQIWDATVANPETSMPPFGRHQILSEKEIDAVVDFIHAL